MFSSSHRRSQTLIVAPIECADESEQLESTTLSHLSRRQSTAIARPSIHPNDLDGFSHLPRRASTQPMASHFLALPVRNPTMNSCSSSHIYIKPNLSRISDDEFVEYDTSMIAPADDPQRPLVSTCTERDYTNKIHCLQCHKDTVLCVATCKFRHGNHWKQYIFSGSQDSSIGVWNTDTFQLEGTLLGHSRSILGLYVMNENVVTPCLVSTSRDNCICLWDIASLSLLFRITGFPSLVYDIECLSFANDGGYYLYGCCQDTNIFVLSLSILPYLMLKYHDKLRTEHQQKQQMAAFKKKSKKKLSKKRLTSPTNKTTCDQSECRSMLNPNRVLLFNKPSILCPTDFNGPWMDMHSTAGAPSESQLQQENANDKQEDTLSPPVSHMIASSEKFQLPTSTSEIKGLITSDPVVQFLSKSVDEMIDIYYELVFDDEEEEAEEEEETEQTDETEPFMIHRVFSGCHRGFIYVMKQIQNEYRLITSASDGTCKIWDVSNKYKLKLLSVLTGHTHSIIDCDLMSDRYLVTASRDETVKVWNIGNINKPHTRHTINGHDSELTAVKAIDAMNACVIVSASRSGRVIFCSGKSYDWIATYRVMNPIAPDTVDHKVWTCSADVMEQNQPICVMRFEFIEPSWLLLCDTANTVQIWNIEEILQSQIGNTALQLTGVPTATATAAAAVQTLETVLTRLGLTEYIAQFKAEKVDYTTLRLLTENDLIQISIPLGPRKKICHFIQDMKMNRSVVNRNGNMIADLSEFVAFKSISCKVQYQSECWNAAYYIQSVSEQFGAETRLVQGNVGKNPVVLARFAHTNKKHAQPIRIVMYGHYDVVDINNETGWNSPPFELTGRNGYLYGRGATDNKGPIVVFLYAIRELLEHIQDIGNNMSEDSIEIIMIIEGCEEYEWKAGGLTHVVEQNMDWLAAPTVIVCSNSYWLGDKVPCLVYGMRGHLQINVEINGSKQDCHSGVHGGAFREPMFDLISVLSKLKGHNNVVQVPGFYDDILMINEQEQKLYDEIASTFDTRNYLKSIGFAMDKCKNSTHRNNNGKTVLMQKWRNPSLSVHNVQQSSNECTVISKHASAVISIRTVPNQNNMDIISKCKEYLSAEFNKLSTFNTIGISANNIGDHWLMDCNNFIFKCAHKAIVKHWKCKPYYIREGGTIPSTNYLHNKLKAPILQFPLGQSTDRAHLENERIRLQNLLKGKEVMKSFLLNLIQHHHPQQR